MLEEAIKRTGIKEIYNEKAKRYTFSKVGDLIEFPNLIGMQIDSYNWFIKEGIREVLRDVSPIQDYNGNLVMEFFGYRLEDETNYDLEVARDKNATYSRRLNVNVRLINKETGEIKEQEIFLGDIPQMTPSGTFLINGAERVIVNQIVRSPGCYFTPVEATTKFKAKNLYNANIIPIRGAWLEFETDPNGTLFTRVDKRRKLPATLVLRALGLEKQEDILALFGEEEALIKTLDKDVFQTQEEALVEIYKKNRPGELPTVEAAKTYFEQLFFTTRRYYFGGVGRFKINQKLALTNRINKQILAEDIINPETGEILFEKGHKLNYEEALSIQNAGINRVLITFKGEELVVIGNNTVDLEEFVDKAIKEELNILERVHYPTLKSVLEKCEAEKLDIKEELQKVKAQLVPEHILKEDILATVNFLLNLMHGMCKIDIIDHLGNRRIRRVGESLQNQFRIGLARLEKKVKERMTIKDLDTVTPQTLINIKPVSAAIKEFFGSSQLSQFMDQTNPLAELSHKRRVSSLGPGGLSRERAGFEVRDVHYTHYGRLCPIESPEGQNIGLILHLAGYSKINNYGFLETPYRKIDKNTGKVTDEIMYMSADTEDNFAICQATEPINSDGTLKNERVRVRYLEEIIEVDRSEVDYMDVSPKQLVSVATAMIPFLENDDGGRALMGSNMQRQAVPLIKTDSPIVGTGMEYRTAKDSGILIVSETDGTVKKVTGEEITVVDENNQNHTYTLKKFKRTNSSTCINQKPIVKEGEKVSKGQTIADSMATDNGEMALGRNALIAFTTWEGYTFEDAILINERLVREDMYTSVHIEDYEIESRDTKLGPEEITREIPNVSEDALKDLDEDGIIRIGASVKVGDILVGKITPKGETELTAEEKLLRAIFGEKSREVRDTSLRVKNGEEGVVLDVKRFNRKTNTELKPGVNEVVRVYIGQKRKITVGDKMAGRHGNKGIISRILPEEDMPYLPDGTPIDILLNPQGIPSRMNIGQVLEVHLGEAGRRLGVKFSTPVFDGATEEDIQDLLVASGASEDGKTVLYDGRTGEPFENKITVGVMYMLKLHHLVDDKMHARSTGPYSLVTKQPLGGKAQFGGQRLGEMEVWALEGYGAAYNIQEMLTVKSDDVRQRDKTYEAIIKGINLPTPGIPESFKVLIKELQSLGLNLELLRDDETEVEIKEDSGEEEINTIKTREEIANRQYDAEDYNDEEDEDEEIEDDDKYEEKNEELV
ncbi:MAG: DNA-directed RNA polymerase subunit beta [Clostridium sp.]